MNNRELQDLLSRELQPVTAPDNLWYRVEVARARPVRPERGSRLRWMIPAVACAMAACIAVYAFNSHRREERTMLPNVAHSVPGYSVSQARTTVIGGEPVRHLVLTPEDRTEAISLFISASKITLPADRPESPMRMVQFPCSKQVCMIVCRKCSEKAVAMLSAQLSVQTPDLW